MSRAILPGSYDPITLGHLDIIKRAAALYDEVVVAVMNNSAKEYRYSLSDRAEMVKKSVESMEHVGVVADNGLLIDLFDSVGADIIVKGVRDETDRVYEQRMAQWNLRHNPRAKTVFLQAADDFEDISSTLVRRLISEGKTPEGLVPDAVLRYIRANKLKLHL